MFVRAQTRRARLGDWYDWIPGITWIPGVAHLRPGYDPDPTQVSASTPNPTEDTGGWVANAWNQWFHDVSVQAGNSAEQFNYQCNARIRANGVDPATGKLIVSPDTFQKVTGVDPSDPQAILAWMKMACLQAKNSLAAGFAQAQKQERDRQYQPIDWTKIVLYGGAAVGGAILLNQVVKRSFN